MFIGVRCPVSRAVWGNRHGRVLPHGRDCRPRPRALCPGHVATTRRRKQQRTHRRTHRRIPRIWRWCAASIHVPRTTGRQQHVGVNVAASVYEGVFRSYASHNEKHETYVCFLIISSPMYCTCRVHTNTGASSVNIVVRTWAPHKRSKLHPYITIVVGESQYPRVGVYTFVIKS